MPPLTPSETRSLLEEIGHRPVRKLGQNFLIDGNIVRKSLELACIQKGDAIVEIGPGLGTLSRALVEKKAIVYAVEKDRRLAAYLGQIEALQNDHFKTMEGDALDFPLASLPKKVEMFKIVANLPYAISTPWMDRVLENRLPQSMTLMLQKEAAQRYAAKHGGKQFGPISIFLQAAYEIADSHNVKAQCFFPKPDVDSQLLHLTKKTDPYLFSNDIKSLIRKLFQQRRKQIGAILRGQGNEMADAWLSRIESLGIDAKWRPEQISLEKWVALARE